MGCAAFCPLGGDQKLKDRLGSPHYIPPEVRSTLGGVSKISTSQQYARCRRPRAASGVQSLNAWSDGPLFILPSGGPLSMPFLRSKTQHIAFLLVSRLVHALDSERTAGIADICHVPHGAVVLHKWTSPCRTSGPSPAVHLDLDLPYTYRSWQRTSTTTRATSGAWAWWRSRCSPAACPSRRTTRTRCSRRSEKVGRTYTQSTSSLNACHNTHVRSVDDQASLRLRAIRV